MVFALCEINCLELGVKKVVEEKEEKLLLVSRKRTFLLEAEPAQIQVTFLEM